MHGLQPSIRRMWINQPSALSPLHDLHGTNVLAVPDGDDAYRVYFLSGPTVCMRASFAALSEGWKQ
jgi:hypothetical protein